jgi:DNA-binding XRE family transcriptional regulator
MDQITTQVLRVQKFVGAAIMTKTELAARAGLPLTTLIGMEKADWNPRSTTLRALVRAIDCFESGGKKKARRELQLAS